MLVKQSLPRQVSRVRQPARPADFRGTFDTSDVARALFAEGAGIYRIVPAAVAVPADVEDVARLARWASATGTALIPRAAGSGMAGGNVGEGVVVDMRRPFRGPVTVDPERKIARAGAGVSYRDLNGAAAAYGLRLPPDPSSGAFCTIGGMVATNAAGSRTHKYGAIRAWVESVGFVTAEGEIGRAGTLDPARSALTTAAERRLLDDVAPYLRGHQLPIEEAGPRTRKNASGYRLAHNDDSGWIRHLLIGSEGTLALLTDVAVRLAPLPGEPTTLLLTLRSLEDVAPAVMALDPLGPAAVELLDRTYLDFVRAAAQSRVPPETEAVLLVEFEGRPPADAARAVAGIAATTAFADTPEAASRLWELRHLASPILAGLPDSMRSLQVVEDGCVPLERLGEYITGLRRIAAASGFEIVIFGHAGDGNVHANLLADVTAADLAPRLHQVLSEATTLVIGLGGSPTGEHGDGRLRAPFLEQLYGPVYAEACRRVKAAFDPAGILNPGVKLAGRGATPIAADTLKVGRGAPALPREAALALREIEKHAGYAVDRLELLNGNPARP